MNTVSEAVLSAVDVLVNEAVSKLEYDKTIQAQIYSIVNLDTGEYKVRYAGNIFSAFSSDLSTKYKVGDAVYVNVPEGNFSNKKVITSPITTQSLSYGEMVSLTNTIVERSPGLETMYEYAADGETGVVAGAPADSPLSYSYIYQGDQDGYHGLFQQYSKTYELIQIEASFLTAFHNEHSKGNYGLEVQFFTKSNDIVTFILDLSSFTGDPYALSVYSPQSLVVKAQLGYLTGLKSIKLFEENFEYDRYVEAGLVTDKQNTTDPNIFVKDISIKFVEQHDLTDNLYHLTIGIPQGNSFTDSIISLDLVGKLLYDGENILNSRTCQCYWYKRDLSVVLGDEDYDKNAGLTWKRIDGNFDMLTVKIADVPYKQDYKLVVIYNENVVMSAEMTLHNLAQSSYDLAIAQNTIGDKIELQIVNNLNDEVLLGDWYLSYPDGSYSQFSTQKNVVEVTDKLIYSAVNFYCAVYKDSKVIANLQHLITTSESKEDVTIVYDGEDSFHYDANGDVTIEDAEKERTLQVILTWKDGVGTSYKVEWIGPDGQLLTPGADRYTPEKSMIQNLWVDNNSIFHYTIKQKYKVNYNNNTITVKIITIDEKEYIFEKEILFTKDGDQGTNGTTYIATIRPYNTATGLKLSGLQPLIYRSNKWQNTLPLRCYVYKDGELINTNSNYTLDYKWSGIGVSLANGSAADRKLASGTSEIATGSVGAYAKVQVTINDRMNGRKYDIYCSYPIDVALNFTNDEISLIDIEDIPSYIKYTASGINPSFYNNNITFLVGNADLSKNITSLTPDLLDIELTDNLYYLKPATSFIFEDNSIALLKCTYDNSKALFHPIMMYLDTYGNEAINGWDGTSLELDEEGGHIFAPQIGAGEKDSANRFTGVVMGKDQIQDKIGLYGYQKGVNTFGLMQDGRAFFGAKSGGGQIEIDGTSATIIGGGGGDSANGMTITLANIGRNGEAIKLGAGNFVVTYDGTLTATGADIQGSIYAKEGKIGSTNRFSSDGWTIITNKLYSGAGTTYVALDSDKDNDYAIWAGRADGATAPFSVTKKGALKATEAHIKGDIYANYIEANTGGTIAGWEISSTELTSKNGNMTINSNGSMEGPTWSIDQLGNAEFGNISANNIWSFGSGNNIWTSSGGFTFNNGILGKNTVNTSGFQFLQGLMSMGNPTLTSATPGIKIGQNGSSVQITGDIRANNGYFNGTVYANAGDIGGCQIIGGKLTVPGANIENLEVDKLTSDGKTLDAQWAKIRYVTRISASWTNYFNYTFVTSVDFENESYETETIEFSNIPDKAIKWYWRESYLLRGEETEESSGTTTD